MPPQNAGYYYAAYIAGAIIYLGYAASVFLRARGMERRLRELDSFGVLPGREEEF